MFIAGIQFDTYYNRLQCRTFHYYIDGHTSMLCHHSSMGTQTKKKEGTDLGFTGVVDSFYYNDTYYDS